MAYKDYYKILGVAENADLKAIKKVYKKLAMKLHPDVNPQGDGEEKFKEIVQAYEVLKNPKLRAEYDELRKYGGTGDKEFNTSKDRQNSSFDFENASSNGDFSDFFHSTFNRQGFNQSKTQSGFAEHGAPFSQKGQDAEIELAMLLEDTVSKSQRTIQFSIPIVENGRLKNISKTLKVSIPKGVADNDRIRLKGQGGPGYGQGPNGDLYLHIKFIPHPLFDVEAHNLILSIPISPWEAALGASVTVPTLSGQIKVNIKPNSQTGQKLRLKGKGLAGKSTAGDMIGVLKIVIPPQSTENEKALWRQFEQSNTFNPRKHWSD